MLPQLKPPILPGWSSAYEKRCALRSWSRASIVESQGSQGGAVLVDVAGSNHSAISD